MDIQISKGQHAVREDDWQKAATPWWVEIRSDDESEGFGFRYYRGTGFNGEAPGKGDVRECIASDLSFRFDTFEDYCAETGADFDSRKAEADWHAMNRQAENLERVIVADGYDVDSIIAAWGDQ